MPVVHDMLKEALDNIYGMLLKTLSTKDNLRKVIKI